MSIVNKTVFRLLGKTISGDNRWSTETLLVADGILRLFEQPSPVWDVYRVGLQTADDTVAIEDCRQQILEDQIDPRTWKFDVLADAWTACMVINREELASEPVHAVIVEILNPFDYMDVGGVLSSYCLDGIRRAPPASKRTSLDFSKMGPLR